MREELHNELSQAFADDLADAVKPFAGVRTSHDDDDWLINDLQPSEQRYTGRGVFTGYGKHEIDGLRILQHDVKLICLQGHCSDALQVDDVIVQGERRFKIIYVKADAVSVSFTAQLRAV
ncbi:MAG: glutamate 5-kinase [Acinetobacter sp.]|nr:glutamate 5-kinase [Acinetobacter sp.]